MTRWGTWWLLVCSLLLVNVLMFLTFFGASGTTARARRALEPASLTACADEASRAAGLGNLRINAGSAHFVGPAAVEFTVSVPEVGALTVVCRFDEPGDDTDGALPVRSVEVQR